MKRNRLAGLLSAAIAASAASSMPAFATSIPDGSYLATFGPTECGQLTVEGNSMGYMYGRCSSGKMSEVTYTAQSVSRRGDTVRIDQARLKIETVESNRMIGVWTLGDYSARKIFMKQ